MCAVMLRTGQMLRLVENSYIKSGTELHCARQHRMARVSTEDHNTDQRHTAQLMKQMTVTFHPARDLCLYIFSPGTLHLAALLMPQLSTLLRLQL